jgi:hypothetical protein
MRDIIAQTDFEFEEFDPTTAALENPEIEVPRSYSSNLRLEKGRNIVRFVPKMKDRPLFQQVVEHWVTGADNKRFPVPCRKAHIGEDCPVCDKASQLKAAGMVDVADEMYPSKRWVALVIDMKNPSLGVQMLSCTKTIYEGLNGKSDDPSTGLYALYGNYASAVNGYDVHIIKTIDGQKTSYSVQADPRQACAFKREWLEYGRIPDIAAEKLVFEPAMALEAKLAHLQPPQQRRGTGLPGGRTNNLPR